MLLEVLRIHVELYTFLGDSKVTWCQWISLLLSARISLFWFWENSNLFTIGDGSLLCHACISFKRKGNWFTF